MTTYTLQQLATQRTRAQHALSIERARLASVHLIADDVRENHRHTITRRIEHYASAVEWLDAAILQRRCTDDEVAP